MTEAQDLGSKELLAATLREREQAGVHATAYYYSPGWGPCSGQERQNRNGSC